MQPQSLQQMPSRFEFLSLTRTFLVVGFFLTVFAVYNLVQYFLIKTEQCSTTKTSCPSCWKIGDNEIPISVELQKKGLEDTAANRRYVRRSLQSNPKFPGCGLSKGCPCITGCQCKSGACSMLECH